jgi:septal ring factor EnvC (AmiA/AmiB activator)
MPRAAPVPNSQARRIPALALASLFGLGGFACDARAQSSQDLTTIQQQIEAGRAQQAQLKEQAAQLDKEIADLQAAAVKAASQVQDTESQVTELEDTLAALSDEEQAKTQALSAERARLTGAVLALQRLSSQPPEALLFSSEAPIDAARTARLLGLITPALDARARALQSDLNELHEMRQEMAQRRDDLSAAVGKLAGENGRLSDLISRKAQIQRSTLAESDAAQARLEKLASQAKSLQDLVDRLNKAKAETGPVAAARPTGIPANAPANSSVNTPGYPAGNPPGYPLGGEQVASAATGGGISAGAQRMEQPPDFRNFPDATHVASPGSGGTVVFAPARGRITTHFGDPLDTGGQSKGLVLETRPGAQIVAPFDGRIAFEGPFRSYGQILIIEHGGGYHTVLAGLDRVDAVVGQWLLAGEPVGVMAAPLTGRPKLYLELRRDGQPVDPVPWFGTAEAKAVNSKGQ